MSIRNVFAHLLGVVFLVAGFAWLALDVRPDGHVALATAIGVAILVAAGGWLVDKDRTLALFAFLLARARELAGVAREILTAKSGGA